MGDGLGSSGIGFCGSIYAQNDVEAKTSSGVRRSGGEADNLSGTEIYVAILHAAGK